MKRSTDQRRRHPVRGVMVAFSTLALLATACGDDKPETTATPAAPSAVEVEATDYGFSLRTARVQAGRVVLTLANKGAENHHLTLIKVGDGARAEDVVAGLRKGDGSVMARTTAIGGPNGVAPGAKGSVTVDLTPGSYVMVCHIPSPQDQVAHSSKGMVSSFTVEGPVATALAAPSTAGSVSIAKDGYKVSGPLASGSYRVQNDLDQPAEAALVRLRTGATAKDVLAFLGGQAPPGPPPFSVAGGVTTLAPVAAPWSTSTCPRAPTPSCRSHRTRRPAALPSS